VAVAAVRARCSGALFLLFLLFRRGYGAVSSLLQGLCEYSPAHSLLLLNLQLRQRMP
jgi:hypothetical protein